MFHSETIETDDPAAVSGPEISTRERNRWEGSTANCSLQLYLRCWRQAVEKFTRQLALQLQVFVSMLRGAVIRAIRPAMSDRILPWIGFVIVALSAVGPGQLCLSA